MRFVIVEHEDACPPSWLGEWWSALGVELVRARAHAASGEAAVTIPVSVAAVGADALVVLGGEAGANDDADHPWLPATRALIARTVADGIPFLGVCLGHQLAGVALGGVAGPNPFGHSTGLTPVALTEAGREDALLADFEGALAVQWNNDVILTLPPGATVLATAPDGTPQAVRFGPRAWGVQFHPEVSPAQFDSWTIDKPSAATGAAGLDLAGASAAIHAAGAVLRQTWRPFAEHFVAQVSRPRAMTRPPHRPEPGDAATAEGGVRRSR